MSTDAAVSATLAPIELPDFPWDLLAPYKKAAAAHPGGLIDLSIGTPVDSTPPIVRDALVAAADAPGYPAAAGTPALGAAAAGWLARRLGVSIEPDAIVPSIGSKELVAGLPFQLGVPVGARVVIPTLAYPTYDVGVRLARAVVERTDTPPADPAGIAMVWLNSPANPTGEVASPEELRAWVEWGRAHGVPIVNDECYVELGWETEPVSILHPSISGGSHAGVLAVHSLSKRSNLAGYRAGFVAGDPALIGALLEVRRHAGFLVPRPVQQAMVAAYDDDAHVEEQKARYAARRQLLRSALVAAGFEISHSEAGLYLWATRGEGCWQTLAWLAERGLLVAPGAFYGETGLHHVRVALTVTDADVDQVVARLA